MHCGCLIANQQCYVIVIRLINSVMLCCPDVFYIKIDRND